jgi:uncharacterized membrane protein SpoIIM required for sporulation
MQTGTHTLAMSPTTTILLWAGILIVLAMLGGFAITVVRRNMLGDHTPNDAGSMMEQMRKMVDRGQMTQQEFDLARRKIVERAKQSRDEPTESP